MSPKKNTEPKSKHKFSQDDELKMKHFMASSNFHNLPFYAAINLIKDQAFHEASHKFDNDMSDSDKFKLLAEISEVEAKMREEAESPSKKEESKK